MISAVPKEIGSERAEQFELLLKALWFSGMRISEAIRLNSKRVDCHHIERPRNQRPRIVFLPSQKNGKFQKVLMTPEFDEFIRAVTPDRDGYFFVPLTKDGAEFREVKNIGRAIRRIGKRAGIISKINDAGEVVKYATAHDLRRSFAARCVAKKYSPYTLKHLMRHADIKTTLQFYAGDQADLVASEVWSEESVELERSIDEVT